MFNKQTKVLLIALLVFMQSMYGISFSTKVGATAITEGILDSVSMAVYNSAGQVVTDNVYEQGAKVKLDYTWSLPNGHVYRAGDTYSFTLPQQFLLFNDVTGNLTMGDDQVGTFHVDRDSHLVVITFNNFIESHDNVKGTLTFNTQFNKSQITGSTTQIIKIPINSGEQVFTLTFKPTVPSTISKTGTAKGFNAKQIDWTVDVNKSLDVIQGAVVTDPMPAGLAVPVTVAVYDLDVHLDGTMVQGGLLDSSKYTVSTEGNALSLHFTDSPIVSAYRIQYSTPIVDSTKGSFVNTATLAGSNKTPVQASATVAVQHGNPLDKTSTEYISTTQTIRWAIKYNYNEGTIAQEAASLTDLYNDTQDLVPGSLKVFPVTFNSAGGEVLGSELPASEYTLTPLEAQAKKGFKLLFNNDISSAYTIIYQTKANTPVIDNATITNQVTSGSGIVKTATKPIIQVAIVKTVGAVDYVAQTVGWNLTINGDSQEMSHVILNDTFPNKGLRLLPDSLVIKKGATILDPTEYTVDSSVALDEGLKITFANTLTSPITISYKTEFNLDWIQPAGSINYFLNSAKINWIDRSEVAQSKTVMAKFEPRDEVKNNGFKNGTYDLNSKQITWNVGFNYNGKTLEAAMLEDFLESNQKLVDSSNGSVTFNVYHMNVQANGATTIGSTVDRLSYDYHVDANNKLVVTFKQPISGPYYLVFKTSLEGQLLNSTVKNTAKLFDGDKPVSNDLTASVPIPHGGEYVSKEGLQSGDKINWKITINRGQSTVFDAAILDTPTVNQVLLPDSFHLFATTGDLIKGAELTKDRDYTVTFQTYGDGKQTFELRFANEIRSAYILEYQSLIAANDKDTVSNKVSFSGNNEITVTKETVQDILVGVSSGSGTGSGVRGALSVKKVDAADRNLLLGGATFELYRKSGETKYLIRTVTTNATGTADFTGLLAGEYVVKETISPAGYVLNSIERPITLHSAENLVITVTNERSNETGPSAPPGPSGHGSRSESSPTPSASPIPKPSVKPAPTVSPSPSPSPSPKPSTGPTPSASPEPTAPVIPVKDDNDAGGNQPGNHAETLPVTGESSHTFVKLAGLALILSGFLLRRRWRKP
ncbi:LPXTG cell wall anchor domain-containing protein [Paenibacillus aceris]|uniref:LPXTG-motif cell wall-anchored protein n=1 Tax=Paenibacillus aceris TaxID=869555 RepID=A0ABS4I8H1_9BACL|nr:LPXTG cell wall anchor domain-containing protein [Paenibacillus aceris]MBP1967232.1 LPXTG-motif cell wall-anchored protein [Paenibacillus aceris]NHW36270.1 LPXTG cell wall anchor domain-containing protein [Paenibacillus aceris]